MAIRSGMKVGSKEHVIQHDMLVIGSPAPDFALTANDSNTVKSLADYAGKIKVISCVPSLDTRVCALQTRTFNQRASEMSEDVVILTISADLPFAQRRWCAAEGIDRVETLSDHMTMKFSDDYGVHDLDWRTCQRAVFVVDKDNTVQYAEYMAIIGEEPSYEAALAKVNELLTHTTA
jgi:thioredoxin-dependent peroxiredoxin